MIEGESGEIKTERKIERWRHREIDKEREAGKRYIRRETINNTYLVTETDIDTEREWQKGTQRLREIPDSVRERYQRNKEKET